MRDKDFAEQLKAVKARMSRQAGASSVRARKTGPNRAALLSVPTTGTGPREQEACAEFSRTPPALEDYFVAAELHVVIDASRWSELRSLIAADLEAGRLTSAAGKEGCIELCRKARAAAQVHHAQAETESERDRQLVRLARIRRTAEMVEQLAIAAEIAHPIPAELETTRPDRVGVTPLKSQNVAQDLAARRSQPTDHTTPAGCRPAPIAIRAYGAQGVSGSKTATLAHTQSARRAVDAGAQPCGKSASVDEEPCEAPPQAKVEPVPCVFRPLPKPAPTRTAIFRMPQPWVANGGKVQHVENPQRRAVDIVVGLDFGTCFTKAAVGMMDKVYPVTWEGVSAGNPDYLLASEYTEFEDGRLFIGQHPQAGRDAVHSDLKLPFINNAVSAEAMRRAAVFLALVLRYVRAWVYRCHGDKLGRATIRWQLNIGAPSNGLESDDMARTYCVLAASAWNRSLGQEHAAPTGSDGDMWTTGQIPPGLLELPYVCPEFVAQMAGYVKSPQRQRGLHALVDVGGGTLDIVTFIVHAVEEEDTFPFLVPEIRPLGTHGLLQNRLIGTPLPEMLGLDELAPVQPPAEFARSTGLPEVHVRERDDLFAAEVRSVITRVFGTTKRRRYRLSDAWKHGVRTFFTGGGCQLALYEQSLRSASVPSEHGLILSPLPSRPGLDGFAGGAAEYQRVSVACGLAQDRWNLGRIVPAKEVEDDMPTATLPSTRADRDDLYPK